MAIAYTDADSKRRKMRYSLQLRSELMKFDVDSAISISFSFIALINFTTCGLRGPFFFEKGGMLS